MKTLREAGIPTGVMFAPVIPALNDDELESVLEAARDMGALSAGYVLLRLPLEIKDLFREWLDAAGSGPRQACDEPDPPDARRQGLRQRLGQTHDGRGALCAT